MHPAPAPPAPAWTCPQCKYELVELETKPTTTCPECGKSWSRVAIAKRAGRGIRWKRWAVAPIPITVALVFLAFIFPPLVWALPIVVPLMAWLCWSVASIGAFRNIWVGLSVALFVVGPCVVVVWLYVIAKLIGALMG